MKKNRIYGIILVVLLACQSLLVRAENKEFDWSASATMTSNYLWRGLYCGSLVR